MVLTLYRRFHKTKTIQYLDLKNDCSFGRFFSTCKAVLFSLIKRFLPISDDAPDWSTVNLNRLDFDKLLYLQDTSIPPNTPAGKQAVLDLYVALLSGANVNIEMQNYTEEDFSDKIFTYWVQSYPPQLKRGQKPAQAKPHYSLAFTISNASSRPHHISRATTI